MAVGNGHIDDRCISCFLSSFSDRKGRATFFREKRTVTIDSETSVIHVELQGEGEHSLYSLSKDANHGIQTEDDVSTLRTIGNENIVVDRSDR